MNLYEESKGEIDDKKSKFTMKILIFLLIIVTIMAFVIGYFIKDLKKKELKLFINNKKIPIKSGLILMDDPNNIYISLEGIAENLNYTMNYGEYKNKYEEDRDKCYLKNQYEAVSYIKDSDEIYKNVIDEENDEIDYCHYKINNPVIEKNKKLYVTLDGLGKGCNVDYSYKKENNQISIYTLDYLNTSLSKNIKNSSEPLKEDDLNTYLNKRAVLYNRMVVEDEEERFGVVDLSNKNIIGVKYKKITFLEENQEFLIETFNEKIGLMDIEGNIKIHPKYNSLKKIDKKRELYLISEEPNSINNKVKFGVINGDEDIILHPEYDEIGINKKSFPNDDIENRYFIYDKNFPVRKGQYWGLIDIYGKTVLGIEYEQLGCKEYSSSENTQANSMLLLPEYEAIVAKKNKLYGLYDLTGETLIEPLVDEMFTVYTHGQKKYYLFYENNKYQIIEYLKSQGIQPVKNRNDDQTNNDEIKDEETHNPTIQGGNSTEEENIIENENSSENIDMNTEENSENSNIENNNNSNKEENEESDDIVIE